MDNKIEHFFVLKPDGKIYWIQEPVKVPAFASSTRGIGRYNHALQYAIDNAVEVSNFDETEDALLDAHATGHGFRLEIGKIYSLQCSVEKKEREIAQCCECDKAIYKENRFQRDDGNGFTTSVCPECGEESFYNLKEVLALVTFSKPEDKETQEELEDGVQLTLSMNLGTFGRVIKALKTDPELWEEVKDELTRLSKEFKTRKTP